MEDVKVVVGGVIPKQDINLLKEIGIAAVFPGGTPFSEITGSIQSLVNGG